MNDLLARNLELVRTALHEDDIHFFSTPEKLTVYTPCKVNLRHRTLRPTSLRVTILPKEDGVLFETSLPVTLQASDDEERRVILRRIAKENYGTIRGGLTYQAETGQLRYRMFYAIGQEAECFANDEVAACVRFSASSLSEGYECIVNELDENGSSDDSDHASAPSGSLRAELDALFDHILARRTEAEQGLPAVQDSIVLDADEAGVIAPSEDEETVDPSLRAMLDGLLNDGTESE
ncbi:MAG: hypothetical protein SOY30_07450 [Eubacteriales bacterium]|nr:hypothetical protein [Eubacteriales bacterium]